MYQYPPQLKSADSWNANLAETWRNLLEGIEWTGRILLNQANTDPTVMAKLQRMCPNLKGKYPEFGEGIELWAQELLNLVADMRADTQ